MRTSRSFFLSIGGLALCASLATFGVAMTPVTTLACPDEANAAEGKCACGRDKADCEAAKADGSCGGCEHGKAAGKDAKACACAPGDDGTVMLNAGGQEGDYPAGQIVNLDQVQTAARAFFVGLQLEPSLQWERQ